MMKKFNEKEWQNGKMKGRSKGQRKENNSKIQIRKRAQKFKINIQQSKIDTIKRWMKNLNNFEKKIKKTLSNDMRRYFAVRKCLNKSKQMFEFGS